jgi:hypothetical protein
MKTLFITLSAACAAVATYFGVRYFTRHDLGFTCARKYVRKLAENLRHKLTAAREAATTPNTANE